MYRFVYLRLVWTVMWFCVHSLWPFQIICCFYLCFGRLNEWLLNLADIDTHLSNQQPMQRLATAYFLLMAHEMVNNLYHVVPRFTYVMSSLSNVGQNIFDYWHQPVIVVVVVIMRCIVQMMTIFIIFLLVIYIKSIQVISVPWGASVV